MTRHERQPLIEVRRPEKYFPITRGIVFQRQVGAVKAVDGVSLRRAARARRSGSSARPAAARAPPRGCSSACSIPTCGEILFEGEDIAHAQGRRRSRLCAARCR